MTEALASLVETWRRCWKPPERYAPSQWVERNRVLTSSESAESGPMRLDRTPYVRGIMDAVSAPGVEEVVFVKPTQIGGSETLRNIIGYWIDNDPGPALIVMPDEKSGRELVHERIRPMIDACPALKRHRTESPRDDTLTRIRLDTMELYVGWSGSPQSLATRPCRYVVFDECDKYQPFSGREADPISLGIERTKTYGHRRRVLKISTPTTTDGAIWRAWQLCGDRRHFEVPCPHCNAMQRLIWQQVRWPKLPEPDKVKRADAVQQGRLAWYECGNCKGRIDDRHKSRMLLGGMWKSESDGPSKRVGFHLSALYSPWLTWADIVAQFILAEADAAASMNFRNSWLAEPFEDVIERPRPSMVRERSVGPARVCPDWAVAFVATADTQKDHFYWTIRAWAGEFKSRLVAHGIAHTFDELYSATLQAQYVTESGQLRTPTHLLIDSGGGRTNEVYQFAARDSGRILPCKGASHHMRRPWTINTLANGTALRTIDTGYFKDMLSRLMKDSDVSRWSVHGEIDEDYCLQLASEHKILDRKSGAMRWVPVSSGARNHYWDCEVLQCAAADMANLGVHHIAPPPPQMKPQAVAVARDDNRPDWMPPRPERWL